MSFPDGPGRSRSCPNTGNFLGNQLQAAAPKGKPPPRLGKLGKEIFPGFWCRARPAPQHCRGIWGGFRDVLPPGAAAGAGNSCFGNVGMWECPPALSWVIPGPTSAPSGSPGRSRPARCSWRSHPHLEKPQGTAAGWAGGIWICSGICSVPGPPFLPPPGKFQHIPRENREGEKLWRQQ